MKPVIMMGAGAHATVVLDVLNLMKIEIAGICDPRLEPGDTFKEIKVFSEEQVEGFSPDKYSLVNSIGSNRSLDLKRQLFIKYKNLGFGFVSLMHPSAVLAGDLRLGEGVHVMAGAIIQPKSFIGDNTLINSGAIVEHNCHVGSSVHIAPGAVLCSGVEVGEGTHIGAGAVVIQNTSVGNNALIGANVTVLKNVENNEKVVSIKSH